MLFLVLFYYCIFFVGITFILLDENLNGKRTLFNDESDDDDMDEPDNDDVADKTQENPKYEDRYKINDELVDDELSTEKLEGLANCFILEHTPNGNALILYNYKSGSFVYYSDNSIPYKYLNALARKYVNTYKCKKLYTDSTTASTPVLDSVETSTLTKEKPTIEEKPSKKQIFAKFKVYNKNTSNKIHSRTNPSQQQQQQKDSHTLQVDVVANRYTYQGKIANFNFLKKPDKKLVNKKLALTFSDYKKLNI